MKLMDTHPFLTAAVCSIGLLFLGGLLAILFIPDRPSMRENQILMLQKLDAIEKRLGEIEERQPSPKKPSGGP